MASEPRLTFGDVEKAASAVGVHIDIRKQKLDLGESKRSRARGEAVHIALAPLLHQLVAQDACGPAQNSSSVGLAHLKPALACDVSQYDRCAAQIAALVRFEEVALNAADDYVYWVGASG